MLEYKCGFPNSKIYLSKLQNVFGVFCFDVPGGWRKFARRVSWQSEGRVATLCCEEATCRFFEWPAREQLLDPIFLS